MESNTTKKGVDQPLELPKGIASENNPYPCYLAFFHPGIHKIACGVCLYSYSHAGNWTCTIPLVPEGDSPNKHPNSKCVQGGIKSPDTGYDRINTNPENIDSICFYCQEGYVSVEGVCREENEPYSDTKNPIKDLYPNCALIRKGKCHTCRWSEGYFMTKAGLCTESKNWNGNEDRELLGLGIEVGLYKEDENIE